MDESDLAANNTLVAGSQMKLNSNYIENNKQMFFTPGNQDF